MDGLERRTKLRLTVHSAKNLMKKDLFKLPDPFAKIMVDGSGQCHFTEPQKSTLEPQWNQHFDLFLSRSDSVTVSVWNQRKVLRQNGKEGAGFLGCVRLTPTWIGKVKDKGFKSLNLTKNHEEEEAIKGELILILSSPDQTSMATAPSVVTPMSDLPEGWTCRKSPQGRDYFINHYTKHTQWERPTRSAFDGVPTTRVPHHHHHHHHPGGLHHSSSSSSFTRSSSFNARSTASIPNVVTMTGNSSSTTAMGGAMTPTTTSTPVSGRRLPHLSRIPSTRGSPTQEQLTASPSTMSVTSSVVPSSHSSQHHNTVRRPSPSPPSAETSHHSNGGGGGDNREGVRAGGGGGMASSQQLRSRAGGRGGAAVPLSRQDMYRSRNFLHCDLQLPDGYEQRQTPQGQIYFIHLNTGMSTWHDPRFRGIEIPEEDLGPLGEAWEVRYTDHNRKYFVDHINGTTQFTDPRYLLHFARNLITSADPPPASSASPTPPVTSSSLATSNSSSAAMPSNQVAPGSTHNVATAGIHHSAPPTSHHHAVLSSNHGNVANRPPPTVHQNSHPIIAPPPTPFGGRDLIHKMKTLRSQLNAMQPPTGHCRIEVSRKNVFEDSYRTIMKIRARDLKKKLHIKFQGEDGLDYGGIAREWLYLLSHEMLNPIYGLFQYSRDDVYTLQINPDSAINPEHLSYFYFVGRVIGMAVFHGMYLDGGFTLPFYKQLLGRPITVEDLESVDTTYYTSLKWMQENDITDTFDLTFSVDHNRFGRNTKYDLKEDGCDIPVTNENKDEYIHLYVQWRFKLGIEKQFNTLQKGFHEIITPNLLKQFDERELELIVSGLGSVDVDDWMSNTRLKHCTPDTDVVRWFWKAVRSYDDERRARLLQFVTGSSRVPLEGFKALQGSTGAVGPRLFTIHLLENAPTNNLPKAHTCFNRIDLPRYESYDKLLEKLTFAIEHTAGFHVE